MSARLLVLLALAAASCEGGTIRDEVPVSAEADDGALGTYVAGSCAHDPCSTGTKLTKTCDACVTKICKSDSYCCSTKWDQQCVNEVTSVCKQSCNGGGGNGGAGSGGSGGSGTGGTGGGSGGSSGSGGSGGGGGTKLKFAVFGDCRPPNLEGTSHYPSAIIGGIFKLAESNGAQFAVGTGDYMFSNTQAGVDAQVQLFLQARSNYSGPVYLDMGNHECNGYTASNCPNGTETPNVKAFLSKLAPAGVSKPYYRIDAQAAHGKVKLLFIAANAWDSTQQSWLQQQLADPTDYTFVVRHEPAADTQAPGVGPSESLIKAAAYTLELNGHTHEYKHVDTKHVISGNAGAPLQSGASGFGVLMVEEQDNGNMTVTEIDESTGQVIDTWTVTPSGGAA